MLSASRNCMGAVRLLLQYGAEVDAVNNEGQTALFESFEVGTFNVAKLLVEAGSNVNLTDNVRKRIESKIRITVNVSISF